jgi:DNA modification methylase
MPDASVDSVVTDPPYLIGFMGKGWDAADGIAGQPEVWAECLRVLKPGGHLLAFGATRTYHRMTVAIEDAGFEIRDSLHWCYGSGFPKSLDVSKAIDKQRDDRADIYRVTAWIRSARDAAGIGNRDIDAAFDANGMGRHWTDVPPTGKQPAVPTLDQVPTLLDVLGVTADDVPEDIRLLLWDLNGKKGQPGENWAKREVVGTKTSGIANKDEGPRHTIGASQAVEVDITAPATDAARQWSGWGTALKPAHEPIVVARKPLVGTVAGNVLAHGTGALNIDGCRVGFVSEADEQESKAKNQHADFGTEPGGNNVYVDYSMVERKNYDPPGRWPANLVFTHAADCADVCADGCPVAELDGQSGVSKDGVAVRRNGNRGAGTFPVKIAKGSQDVSYGGQGGASRFFTVTEWDPIADVPPFRYVAKPSKRERNAGLDGLPAKRNDWQRASSGLSQGKNPQTGERSGKQMEPRANHHPTVKPVALMRWLVRLVTPPGGTVLDPFAGSGTTLIAATLEGFDAIGIEMTDDYLPIIEGRVAWAEQQADKMTPTLFDDAGQGVRVTSLAGASIDPTGDATPGQGQV